MTELYPLRFNQTLKEKVWGSNILVSEFGKKADRNLKIGESWEISGLPGDESVVLDGFLEGNNLNELIEVYMGDLIGDHVYDNFGDEFPVLVKFIDAASNLSVQVHPDNETAGSLHHAYGKSEVWHILHANKGSVIYCGFKQGIAKDDYYNALETNTIPEILNRIEVHAGESFWIPAGTIHAIGEGIVLAEVQQTSDITYRIFDWQRDETNGTPRELHTELAEKVLNFNYSNNRIENRAIKNQTVTLIASEFFNVNILTFDASIRKNYSLLDSFIVLVCTDGRAIVNWSDKSLQLSKGETILIPASLGDILLEPTPQCTVMEVYMNSDELKQTK